MDDAPRVPVLDPQRRQLRFEPAPFLRRQRRSRRATACAAEGVVVAAVRHVAPRRGDCGWGRPRTIREHSRREEHTADRRVGPAWKPAPPRPLGLALPRGPCCTGPGGRSDPTMPAEGRVASGRHGEAIPGLQLRTNLRQARRRREASDDEDRSTWNARRVSIGARRHHSRGRTHKDLGRVRRREMDEAEKLSSRSPLTESERPGGEILRASQLSFS